MSLQSSLSPAAARRHQRAQVAARLAGWPGRATLQWADLDAAPDWAGWDDDTLQRLAWVVGARAHAASLSRCIDGRVLKRLRQVLGDALAQVLRTDDAQPGAAPLLDLHELDPVSLDTLLSATGRDWLLASVAAPRLRDALRALRWPDAGPPLRIVQQAAAHAVVADARAALAQPETAP